METTTINCFPGYESVYVKEDNSFHNMYRGTDVGYGGYIYGEPGCYSNVALLDIASMHPNSIIAMNCFGEYTKHFKDILDARIAIKHGDLESAKKMFGGRLEPFLQDKESASSLAQALKIAINSVYGLTSASFPNPFRDERNKNNIVALRGALFMRTLQDEIHDRGFTVASIRTDSIKIPDATPEIIQFAMDFAKKYGYTFEHEATYDRMCLVNNSAYIAKYATEDQCVKLYGYIPGDNRKHPNQWTATAKQFQVPYVFKTLFSREPIVFEDLCETFEVKTALYLDKNEDLPEGEHNYQFIGKVGQFCPIKPGRGGCELLRLGKDAEGNPKYDSATGAKGYRWLESEMVWKLDKVDDIDRSYYDKLVDEAIYGKGKGKERKPGISDFCDFEWFVSDDPVPTGDSDNDDPPWDDGRTDFDVR